MRVLYDSKSGYFSAPVPWVRAMGLSKKQECDKIGADRIKAMHQSWGGRTRCYQFPYTVDDWGLCCNVSIISNRGD